MYNRINDSLLSTADHTMAHCDEEKGSPSHMDARFSSLRTLMQEELIGPLFFCEVKSLAQRIVEEWPPAHFHYVGIGRSPSPIIAAIQVRYGRQSALNLPLSNFKHYEPGSNGTVKKVKKICTAERERLFSHFDSFLGAIEPHKKVLVIDYVLTGSSLISATRILHKYYKSSNGSDDSLAMEGRRVHVLGLCEEFVDPDALSSCGINALKPDEYIQGEYDKVMQTHGQSLACALYLSGAKCLAEYEQKVSLAYLMENPAPDFMRNSTYDQMVDYLACEDLPITEDIPVKFWSLLPAKK